MSKIVFTFKPNYNVNIEFQEITRLFKNSTFSIIICDEEGMNLIIDFGEAKDTKTNISMIKETNDFIISQIKKAYISKPATSNLSLYRVTFINTPYDIIEKLKSHFILKISNKLGSVMVDAPWFDEFKKSQSLNFEIEYGEDNSYETRAINDIMEDTLAESFRELSSYMKKLKSVEEDKGEGRRTDESS